jgi:hypothetical protein
MGFAELEIVRVRRQLPEYGLPAGSLGTVVMVYESPGRAYEVEFADSEGITIALLTMLDQDLERVVGAAECP